MVGFNSKAHTAAKLVAANRDRIRERIDKQLGEMIAQLKQDAVEDSGRTAGADHPMLSAANSGLTLARQSRRLEWPATWPVDPDAIVILNEVLANEGDVLDLAQKEAVVQMLRINSPGVVVSPEQVVVAFQSIQERIRSRADEALRRTYTIPTVGGSEETVRVFRAEDEALLEDWLRVCRKPNDAEMFMLAEYVDRDVWEIYDWFKAKRAETGGVYLYLANAAAKGTATALRHAAMIRVQAAFQRMRKNVRAAEEVTKPKTKAVPSSSEGKKRKATTPLETIVEEMD